MKKWRFRSMSIQGWTRTWLISTLYNLLRLSLSSFPAANGSETVPAVNVSETAPAANGCERSIGGLGEVGGEPGEEEDEVLPPQRELRTAAEWRRRGSRGGGGGRRRGRSSRVWPPWISCAWPAWSSSRPAHRPSGPAYLNRSCPVLRLCLAHPGCLHGARRCLALAGVGNGGGAAVDGDRAEKVTV